MKIKSQELVQSYILSAARYDFTVYEKRILYRIVEMHQHLLEGRKLTGKWSITPDLFGHNHYTMPVSAFLRDENDHNYQRVKEAFTALESKRIEYEDDKTWELFRLVQNVELEKRDSFVRFTLPKRVHEVVLNFSKGFKKYELKVAMQFETVYAMRFYELFSNQTIPLNYSIEQIKEMFKIEGKYTRINDFVRFVVEAAKKEMDAKSPWTFDYELKKTGRKITHILFVPRYQQEHEDPDLHQHKLNKEMSISWDLKPVERDYLNHQIGIDDNGIKYNRELITAVKDIKGHVFLDWLAELKTNALRQGNRLGSLQGYVINAMKKVRDNELLK